MTNPLGPDQDMEDRMAGDSELERSRNPLRDRSREADDDAERADQSGADDESAFVADPAAAEQATRERMQEQMAVEREAGHPVSSDPEEELDGPVTARAAGASSTSGDNSPTSDASDAGAPGSAPTGDAASITGSHTADGTMVNSADPSPGDPQPAGPNTPSEYPAPGSPDTAPSGVPAPAPAGEPVPDVAPIPGVSPNPGAVPGDPSAPGAAAGSGSAGSDQSRP